MKTSIRNYYSSFSPKHSVYIAVAWNFALAMVIFTVCRLIFYAFNTGFFPSMTAHGLGRILWGGLQFDLAALIYLNLPYLLIMLLPFIFRYGNMYQNIAKGIFVFFNGLGVVANCIDTIYFRFTLRRTTATIFSEFENENNFGLLIPQFIADYWYVVLIWLALIAALILLFRKAQKPEHYSGFKYGVVYFVNGLALLLICATLIVGGVRGGFRHSTRPISLSNAGAYVNEPHETAIVLNTPFAIVRTLNKQPLPEANYFATTDELERHFDPVQQADSCGNAMKPINVVIFILESFGREYISAYNQHTTDSSYKGYTPFMDSLMQRSMYFRYAYANGHKSIDGMPSVLASIPMVVEPYFLTSYSSNRINSVASLLRAEGYSTAFFHGAPNGSMGFEAFANVAGFERYYGMTEYNNSKDFDGMWAIWDEEFFQYFAKTMDTIKQPFCTAIFSASSHHPFRVPARYESVFPKGTLPIHQCVGYTDYALRRFFETASKANWFSNTLFVFTADHTNQTCYPEYSTPTGSSAVPIIFHRPDGSLQGERDQLAQQIDIMPSVLGYLGYSKPFVAFGRNLFGNRTQPYVFNYSNGIYQLFMDDYLYMFDGTRSTGLYNYRTDPSCRHNLLDNLAEVEAAMNARIKAIIQQYSNRMRRDKLTVQ